VPANPSYQQLLALGEQQGGLTTHDLQQVLDVDRLSIEEISDILARLEHAGISVDIDAAQLSPGPRTAGLGPPLDTNMTDHTDAPPPTQMASAAPRAPHAEERSAVPTLPLSPIGYFRDKAVRRAVSVALALIILFAIFLAGLS
jgi:hypothetical protein